MVYTTAFWVLVYVVAIWELVWKGIALWKCGRNNQLTWFLFILILNTAGILPIVYLLISKDKTKKVASKKAKLETNALKDKRKIVKKK